MCLQGVLAVGSEMHVWHPSVKGFHNNMVKDFSNENDDNILNGLMHIARQRQMPLIGVKYRYHKLKRKYFYFKQFSQKRKRTADFEQVYKVIWLWSDHLIECNPSLNNFENVLKIFCDILTIKKISGPRIYHPQQKALDVYIGSRLHMYDRAYQSHVVHVKDHILCYKNGTYFVVHVQVCYIFWGCLLTFLIFW